MKAQKHFDVLLDYAVSRLQGRVSLSEAVDLACEAITLAKERKISRLMINTLALSGFPSPTLPERYFFARKFADCGRGEVKVVLVVQAEMIDPDRFGVVVARNAGLNTNVFPTEAEALAWLLDDTGHPFPS